MLTRRRAALVALTAAAGLAAYGGVSLGVLRVALTPHRAPHDATPLTDGLAAEAISFTSAEDHVRLDGFLLPGKNDRAIILLHGLDSNCWRDQDKVIARDYVDHGYTVLVFDLRGQGTSGGELLGLGWLERRDVMGAVEVLKQRGFKPGKIGLHGSSYGAATALLAAAAIPDVGAVVADSAFADARDLIDQELASKVGSGALFKPGILFLGRLAYGLDLDEIPPQRAVPRIAPRPILFIHGTADSRIPVEQTKKLVAAAQGPHDVWLLPGVEHTQAVHTHHDEFVARTTAFFDHALGGK